MLGIGASDFLYKRARSQGATPSSFLVIQAILFNLTNITMIIITGPLETSSYTILFGIIEASLLYSAFTIFMLSLSSRDVSASAPIFRLNFIIASVLAIATLGEVLTLGKGVAVALSVIAVFAFSLATRSQQTASTTSFRRFLLVVMLATSLYGASGYIYKLAVTLGVDPLSLITFQGFFFITYSVVTANIKGELFKFGKAEAHHAPFCGVLLSVSSILLVKSLVLGPSIISYPISQLSFVFTGILGIILLREKLDLAKSIGLVVSILAVLFFAGIIF